MGKASSSKKVARAARAGGGARTSTGRRWGFPAAIASIVVVGVGLVVAVRLGAESEAAVHPIIGDHWHDAYGVFICDAFESPQADLPDARHDIHTHEDGLMHIHPASARATGKSATFGIFADTVGLELGDDAFTLPDGRTFTTGDDCGGQEGVVRMLKWAAGDFEGEPEVIRTDFGDVRLLGNGEAYVLAFAPEGAEIPLPPNLQGIQDPGDLAPGETVPDISIPEGQTTPTVPASTAATGSVPTGGTATTVVQGETTVAPAG